MILPPEVQTKLAQSGPHFRIVAQQVRDLFGGYVDERGFAFVSRLKDGPSVSEKIETGRFRRWQEITDIFACAVVVPAFVDESHVKSFIEETFSVKKILGREAVSKAPDVFRFDCTRVVASLREGHELGTIPSQLSFEIQIRTAFEHAWCTATHELAYKGDRIDWRRLRLAAQLKASVEQIDSLVAGYEIVSANMFPQMWPEIEVKAKIEQAFKRGIAANAIPTEVVPASWMRFCDSLFSVFKAVAKATQCEISEFAATALDRIEAAFQRAGQGFPRSISLLQFALGELVGAGLVPALLKSYSAPITAAMRDFYPATSNLKNVFDYELGIT